MPSRVMLVCLVELLLGAFQVFLAIKARPTGYHRFGWFAGAALRGKVISWTWFAVSGVVLVVASVAAMAVEYVEPDSARRDFALQTPAGWTPLSEGTPASELARFGVNAETLRHRGPQLALVAGVQEGELFGLMEGYVLQGAWSPTLEALRETAASNLESFRSQGLDPVASDFEITTLRGHAVGRYQATIQHPAGTARVMVYVIPGGRGRAILTYTADSRIFDRHLPAFVEAVDRVEGLSAATRYPKPLYILGGGMIILTLIWFVTAKADRKVAPSDGAAASEDRPGQRDKKTPRRRVKDEGQTSADPRS